MQAILPLLIVGQILLASFFLRPVDHKKVMFGNVLGVRVAQAPDTTEAPAPPPETSAPAPAAPEVDTPAPPPETSAPAPATEAPAPPAETGTPAPETSTPTPETGTPAPGQPVTETPVIGGGQPTSSETQTEQPTVENLTPTVDQSNLFKDILEVSPSETPTPQASATEAPAGTQPSVSVASTAEVTVEATAIQTAAVLNPTDLLNSAEEVSKQSIDEAKTEESKITEMKDPVEQSKVLVDFATDKVRDISTFIKSDDFASTNFASQRFNDHLDRVVDNINNLPPEKARKVTKQLTNFCNQADSILRSAQLSVPEEEEQDIEINRAKCLEFTK